MENKPKQETTQQPNVPYVPKIIDNETWDKLIEVFYLGSIAVEIIENIRLNMKLAEPDYPEVWKLIRMNDEYIKKIHDTYHVLACEMLDFYDPKKRAIR